jgi:hypothetical protein
VNQPELGRRREELAAHRERVNVIDGLGVA